MSWRDDAKKIEDETFDVETEWRKKVSPVPMEESTAEEVAGAFGGDMMETAHDVAIASAQIQALGHADEIAGKFASMGIDDPNERRRVYEETRDRVQQKITDARTRSPVATTAAEFQPTIADIAGLGIVKKASKAYSLARTMLSPTVQGAVRGAGESPEGYGAAGGLIGGSIGGASQLLIKGLKSPFVRPRQTRARAMGATTESFKEQGIKNRENLDDIMEDLAIYKNPKENKMFDVESGTFKGKGDYDTSKSTAEAVYKNIDEGISQIDYATKKIMAKISPKIPRITKPKIMTDPAMIKALGNIREKSFANPDMISSIDKIMKQFNKTMSDQKVDIEFLQKFKKSLQDSANDGGAYSTVGNISPDAHVYAELANGVKGLINNIVGGVDKIAASDIADLLAKESSLLTMQNDVLTRIAKEKGTSVTLPIGNSKANMAYRASENLAKTPALAMQRAAVGRAAEKIPDHVRGYAERVLGKFPANYVTSMESDNRFASTPEAIIKTPIPRSSKAIMENKEFVLEKIRMSMPMMHDYVEDAINRGQAKIEEVLPAVIAQVPHLFETDQYNRVDGKILSPVDKAKAIEDTIKREDISNSDLVSMIDKISKKGML